MKCELLITAGAGLLLTLPLPLLPQLLHVEKEMYEAAQSAVQSTH